MFATNLANNVSQLVVSVSQWKTTQRTSLGKKHSEMVTLCEKNYWQREVKLRALRSYKISLFNQYCNQVLEQVYAYSIRYNIITQVQRLRCINQYFQFNPHAMSIETYDADKAPKYSQLLGLESNELIENYFDAFNPLKSQEQQDIYYKELAAKQQPGQPGGGGIPNKPAKVETFDFKKRKQMDVLSIPSSKGIMLFEVFESAEEQQEFSQSSLDDVKFDFEDNKVEGTDLYDQILPNLKLIQAPEDFDATDIHLPKRRRRMNYTGLKAYSMVRYYSIIENIIALELSISKYSFSPENVIDLDNRIQNGVAFFETQEEYCQNDLGAIINTGKATSDLTLTQTGKELQKDEASALKNNLATKILNKIVKRRRMKSDMGEEFYSIALKVQELIQTAWKHGERTPAGPSFSTEYLEQYEEIRFLQVISIIQKLSEKYFEKRQRKAGKALNDTLLALSKRDHIKIVGANGTFHLNSSTLDPSSQNIDTSSLIPYSGSCWETQQFRRCVFPILSDKALEPVEITLLESIYLLNANEIPLKASDNSSAALQERRSQYAGCFQVMRPFLSTDLEPLQTNLLCMTNDQRHYISSNLKQSESLLFDYLQHIVQESFSEPDEKNPLKPLILTNSQLKKSRSFLTDQIESRQLKQAILCFKGNQVPQSINTNPKMMKQMQDYFKKELFWKILEEKELLKEARESSRSRNNMSQAELQAQQKNLEDEIFRLGKIDARKITDEDLSKAQKLKIKALQQEQKEMMRNVLLDSILTARAEILIMQSEIERTLIESSVRCLDGESAALANCLKLQSKEVDAYVHPFQQFAVTLYDKVDPLSHLDAINKCSHIQQFLTRLKNRGTEVETLTSGPGYVFTLKDINDCVGQLSKGILKYAEQELRTRSEYFVKKEQHYKDQIYIKDQKIETLEKRLEDQVSIIDKMVNSKMYEKGNQIVYELDQANRSLKILKDNIHTLEDGIRREIDSQYRSKMHHRETMLFTEKQNFKEYKKILLADVQSYNAKKQEDVKKEIKQRADAFKNLEEGSPAKSWALLPRETKGGDSNNGIDIRKISQFIHARGQPLSKDQGIVNEMNQKMAGSIKNILGSDESIFDPEKRQYEFPQHLQDVYSMNEVEARAELAQLCDRTRLMFTFWKVKEITLKQKYENQIYQLNQKLSNNSMLWEQLAEAEKREHILRQELVMTQQSLSNCEKVVEKQRDHIAKLDTEKVRLQNFKQNKGRRLDELEHKVSQYEIFEKVNVEKLIQVLHKQQAELDSLRVSSKNQDGSVQAMQKHFRDELSLVYSKFRKESEVKSKAIENLEQMRQEIKALELNSNGSVSLMWKEKSKELYDLCITLKDENAYLTDKCQKIADIAVELMRRAQELDSGKKTVSPRTTERKQVADDVFEANLQKMVGGLAFAGSLRKEIDLSHQRLLEQSNTLKLASQRRSGSRQGELPKHSSSKDTTLLKDDDTRRKSDMYSESTNILQGSHDYSSKPGRNGPKKSYHQRGRSLLDVKKDFERGKLLQNVVFGQSLLKERQAPGTDLDNVVGGLTPGMGALPIAPGRLSNSRFKNALSMSKDFNQDSLLDSSFISQQHLMSKSGSKKLGALFGMASQQDYATSMQKAFQVSSSDRKQGEMPEIAENLITSLRKDRYQENQAERQLRASKQSQINSKEFYNMKAQLGHRNLYPENAGSYEQSRLQVKRNSKAVSTAVDANIMIHDRAHLTNQSRESRRNAPTIYHSGVPSQSSPGRPAGVLSPGSIQSALGNIHNQ